MKKFFKTTFACTLGVLIAAFVLIMLSVISFTGFVASSVGKTETAYITKEKSILKFDLNGTVMDRYEEQSINFDPMSMVSGGGNSDVVGLDQIRRALEVAAEDANIEGIYITANGLSSMPASVEEIRRLLVNFKEKSGKWIYAYADNYIQSDYIIASVADKVIINPIGGIDLHGLGGSQMFYPGAMEKLGVEYLIFRVGTYKSAVEPFMNKKMSAANREQTLAYLNTIWDVYTEGVTASRGFSADFFNAITDSIVVLRPTKDLLAYNLADTMMYGPEVEDWLKTQVGIEEDKEITFASIAELASVAKEEKKSENKIAVVYACGDIVDEGSGISSEEFVPLFTKIRKDKDIKAVVMRVNSPGGSAYASEQMWAEIEAIKASGKKVIVSMGEMAASGGYYISSGADYIFAENTTLTGSIGVFGMMPCAKELVNDKLGLSFDAARTHKFSSFSSGEALYVGMQEEEAMAMQRSVENTYDLFTRRCAEGRNMSQDDIKKIAEGRVWIGKKAVELGLVDAVGSLEDAIAYAATVSELPDYTTEEYPKVKSSFEKMMEKFQNMTSMRISAWLYGIDLSQLQEMQNLDQADLIQARMETVIIK